MTHSNGKATPSIARLAGVLLAIVCALALVPTAASAEPEFKPTGGTFTGSSGGSNKLAAGGNEIACATNSTKGTISSATLIGGVTITFTGCKSTGTGGTNCTVKSTGAAAGTIATNTLHGVLGLILPKGTGTGIGLLLLPVVNKKIVTVESNKCTVETAVAGNFAGEVCPVGTSQTTGKLVFAAGEKGESIKDFDLSTGGLVKPELEAYGAIASQTTEESLTYSAALEIT
jgi:hypothetical protein